MALITCDFYSEALELSTSMTVILPQATETQIGMSGEAPSGDPPVLYLLHGLSDDDTVWTRRTSIERYVAPLGLAVVMPQVGRSFYSDMAYGGKYWTFLSEELPELVDRFFRVSQRREDTFVAGLSMGGYGAVKLALRQPERFAAAASLSGALDAVRLQREPGRERLWELVLGGREVAGTPDDLHWLLDDADVSTLPSLFVACGTADRLYDVNLDFVARVEARGIEITSSFGPADHEWGYWDAVIQDVLAWLPIRSSEPA